MADGWYNTIEDMERATYGLSSEEFLRKDETLTTTITGVRNVLFGRKLWQNIVTTANTFGILPKKPWERSGFRAISIAGSTGSAGIAEAGAIPATTKPSLVQVTTPPKKLAVSIDISDIERDIEGKDDTAYFADLLEYTADEFKNRVNRGLNTDVTTLPTTNIESTDRAISSYAEVTNCNDITAGDADFQGLDRDAAASWADAYVDHNSNTDRVFALSQLDTVLQNVRPFWRDYGAVDNKVWKTGYDTYIRMEQLQKSQLRYETKNVRYSVNGVQTIQGNDTGFTVASYNMIPVIPDGNQKQDTISTVQLMDLDHLFIGTLKPVTYLESSDYLALNKFVTKGVFHMTGELICTKFGSQGKTRDNK